MLGESRIVSIGAYLLDLQSVYAALVPFVVNLGYNRQYDDSEEQ
jgi:hypothetical protein